MGRNVGILALEDDGALLRHARNLAAAAGELHQTILPHIDVDFYWKFVAGMAVGFLLLTMLVKMGPAPFNERPTFVAYNLTTLVPVTILTVVSMNAWLKTHSWQETAEGRLYHWDEEAALKFCRTFALNPLAEMVVTSVAYAMQFVPFYWRTFALSQ
eukprot:scaffold2986_cov406-Prasinococcus_capsulatus_cf.AAC.16